MKNEKIKQIEVIEHIEINTVDGDDTTLPVYTELNRDDK